MAEITALKFTREISSNENESKVSDIFTDADQQNQLLDLAGAMDGGNIVFNQEKWNISKREYDSHAAEIDKLNTFIAEWTKQEEEGGKKLQDYSSDPEYVRLTKDLEQAQNEFGSWAEGRYGENLAEVMRRNDPEQMINQVNVYNQIKDNPALVDNFATLQNLSSDMYPNFQQDGTQNQTNLQYKDNQLLMRINNLGGSGLNFAIKDDLSIIFSENQQLTQKEVVQLAKFFDDMDWSINNFADAKKLKVVDDNDKTKEIGSFEDVFKSFSHSALENMEIEELRRLQVDNEARGINSSVLDDVIAQKTSEEEFNREDIGVGGNAGQTGEAGGAAGPEQEGNPFASYLGEREKKVSFRKMKGALLARAGIARIDSRCICQKRMPDGSYVISLYNSEQDKMQDGKLDKDGVAKHSKKCSFRIRKNPPSVGLYVPSGSKVETWMAKGALNALKVCGFDYVAFPSTPEWGGDVQSSFLEAAGDQLMCPRLKRSKDDSDGCALDADHWRVIIKTIDDPEKGSKKPYGEVLKMKMRSIGEISAQLSWDETNDELRTIQKQLEGDVRMFHFQKSVLSQMDTFITKGLTEHGWNKVDTACAYKAAALVTKQVDAGQLSYVDQEGKTHTHTYDYLNPKTNAAFIGEVFAYSMIDARKDVIKKAKHESANAIGGLDEDGEIDEDVLSTRLEDAAKDPKSDIKFGKGVDAALESAYLELTDTLGGLASAYTGSKACSNLKIEKHSRIGNPPFSREGDPFAKMEKKPPYLAHISDAYGRSSGATPQGRGGR